MDLTIEESVRRGLEAIRDLHGNHIASVIHLAAYYDFSGAPSPLYNEVTVGGTQRLLRLLQDFEVDQFVFSSTDLVYAPSKPGQLITEDSPLDPKWPYPQSKVATEQVIHSDRGKIHSVILRIAGVYDDFCHSIPLGQQIQRIYERDLTAYVFPGDVSAGRQAFVHNEDVIASILLTIARRKDLPQEVTLLIGEPYSPSFDELQRAIGRLIHDVSWKTREIPPLVAKVGAQIQDRLPLGRPSFIKPWMVDLADDNSELDLSQARTILGWEPKNSVSETLPKMIAKLKADPFVWYRQNELKTPVWLHELNPAAAQPIEKDPHELMRLGEQVQVMIAMPGTSADAHSAKHIEA